MLNEKRQKFWFKAIALGLIGILTFNDISWSLPEHILAPQSRLQPFFERHELHSQNIAAVVYAAGELKELMAFGVPRESQIVKLNKKLKDSNIEVEKEIKSGVLKCSGRKYNYAVFHFKKENKIIKALFIRDHKKLTEDELSELGIKKDEAHYLDYPGLKGVWFIISATTAYCPPESEVLRSFIKNRSQAERLSALEFFVGDKAANVEIRRNNLKRLLLKEVHGAIGLFHGYSLQDRVGLISRALSLSLSCSDRANTVLFLKDLLANSRDLILPAARILVNSYLYIYYMRKPIRVAVVTHLYSGHLKKLDSEVTKADDDILGSRIDQLKELSAVNPMFTWEIVLVADGGCGLKAKAEEFITKRHPEEARQVRIFEIDVQTLARLHSMKGASIVYGIRQAIEAGADAVTCPDFYKVPHLAQLGNLLQITQSKDNTVAIASRRLRDSIIYKVWFRRLSSFIFNKWIWLQSPELLGITDTQSPLKLYPSRVLRDILPVDVQGRFEPGFDYFLSFEVELLRRAVMLGYSFFETPILDALEMSADPKVHSFILGLSGRMARGVSSQTHRRSVFRNVFRIFATGGESFILGHPSLDILVKIPRYYRPSFLRSLVRAIRSVRRTESANTDKSFDKPSLLFRMHRFLGKKTTGTSTGGLLQRLFRWKFVRSMTHAILALAESGRGEDFPQAWLVQGRLGGLVVPFEVHENIEISVLMPFFTRIYNFFIFIARQAVSRIWHLIWPLRWLIRTIWNPLDPFVRWIIEHLVLSWASPLFICFWRITEKAISNIWRETIRLERLIWHMVRPVYQRLYRWASLALKQVHGFFLFINRLVLQLRDHIAIFVQSIFDYTGIGKFLIRFFEPLRPVIIKLFELIHQLIRLLRWLWGILPLPYENIIARKALVMQRVTTIESLLPELQTQDSVRQLIDQYVELYRNLWKRGAFNRDTNILEDSGLDEQNRLVLVDFTDVVFSLEAANQYLKANREFIPRFHFRLFAEMTSPEDLEYYMNSMRKLYEEFLSPEWQALWGAENGQPVSLPRHALQKLEFTANSSLGTAVNKWRFLLDDIVRRYETGVTTYLPLAQNEIPAAILERELNEGSPLQRSLASEIVMHIGRTIGGDLARSEIDSAQYDAAEIKVRLPRKTRKAADKILSFSIMADYPEKWERSKTALLLQRAINEGSQGRVSLVLPHHKRELTGVSAVFIPRDGENAFDNGCLPIDSVTTPKVLAGRLAQEPFVAYSSIEGKGLRLGLLSLQNTKSDVRIFDRRLVDYSRDIIPVSSPLESGVTDTDSGWIVLTAGDNFFLKETQDNTVIQRVLAEGAKGSSFIYFDMLPENRTQSSFIFWLSAHVLDVLEKASRFGPFFSRLIHHLAVRYNWKRLICQSGGIDLPSVIFLRPHLAELLFERMRDLNAKLSEQLDLHRYLILPFQVSLVQWMLLWEADYGISRDDWKIHWEKMQELKQKVKPAGIIYNGIYINANRSRDIYNFYQGAVDRESPGRREQICQASVLPLDQDLINSKVRGDITFRGNYLLFNSTLSCAPGMRLIVEKNVVIDDSQIEFIGPPGEYIIPAGTVIAHSRYRGNLVSNGLGAFWYKVSVSDGRIVPFQADTVHSTIRFANGQCLTGGLPMDFDPKKIDLETGRLYLYKPLTEFSGMSLAELRAQIHGSANIPIPAAIDTSLNGVSSTESNVGSQEIDKQGLFKRLNLPSLITFVVAGASFIYFLVKYFFIPQFNYSGMDATTGTDYIIYYLGPLVDKVLGTHGSVFNLDDFRSVISQGLVKIDHPNSAYSLWALRSAEGLISTPFAFLLFGCSLSLIPFWISLNLWVLISATIFITIAWWSGRQAVKSAGVSHQSLKSWGLLAVSFLVFGFAPCLVSLGLGQINSIVLLLTAASLFTYLKLSTNDQKNSLAKGYQPLLWIIGPLSLALAIGIKIMPAFFLAFLTVNGLWNILVSSRASPKKFLHLMWNNNGMRYAILTSIWLSFITGVTILALGTQRCVEWFLIALPRALNSPPVIAPADLPDLSTYLVFIERAGIISQEVGQVIKLTVCGLFAFFAIKASRIQTYLKLKADDFTGLRLWLGFSFWGLAMFSWTFMRCHYLIFAILIFPPLVAAGIRIKSYLSRATIVALMALSFIGFSHPIPFFLIHGGITNHTAPYSFPVTWYNMLFGYPATLLLATAVWIAMTGLKALALPVESQGKVDLHIHSSHDYGDLTPTQIVEKALQKGMMAIAIVDQHTLSGIEEALRRAKDTTLEVMPGTELRTNYRQKRRDVLVYFPDVKLFIEQKQEIEKTMPQRGSDIKDVIDWAHKFNGVAVYAHPGLFPGEDVANEIIFELFKMGLDGLETDRVFYGWRKSKTLLKLIKRWNLEHIQDRKIFTVGSDYRARRRKGYFSKFWGWEGRVGYLNFRGWDGQEILKSLKTKAEEAVLLKILGNTVCGNIFEQSEPRSQAEADCIIRSAKIVASLKSEVRIAFVIPMYKEEHRLLPKSSTNPFGEDALRRKIAQLAALNRVNPLFKWQIIAVDDGSPNTSSAKIVFKIWEDIRKEYAASGIELHESSVIIKVITPEEKAALGSKKGGAVLLGMREALKDGWADFIGYTDTDISADMRLAGLLLEPLMNRDRDVTIGSRWINGSEAKGIPIKNKISSKLYNWIVRILLPPLSDIMDTQRSFKLFTKEALNEILSNAEDTAFSFDTELLLLAQLNGYEIEEVPISWFDSHQATTFNGLTNMVPAILSLFRQRRHIKKHRKSTAKDKYDMEKVKNAFRNLSGMARESNELYGNCINLKVVAQKIHGITKLKFAIPANVLANSADITYTLRNLRNLGETKFELIVYDVKDGEEAYIIENGLKNAFNLSDNVEISTITKDQISSENAEDKIAIIKKIASLKDNEYLAVATDIVSGSEAGRLEGTLGSQVEDRISIRIIQEPDSTGVISISNILTDWLQAIDIPSVKIILPAIISSKELRERLEAQMKYAWQILNSA